MAAWLSLYIQAMLIKAVQKRFRGVSLDQCRLSKVLITTQIKIFHEGTTDEILYYDQNKQSTKNGAFIWPVTIGVQFDIKPLQYSWHHYEGKIIVFVIEYCNFCLVLSLYNILALPFIDESLNCYYVTSVYFHSTQSLPWINITQFCCFSYASLVTWQN